MNPKRTFLVGALCAFLAILLPATAAGSTFRDSFSWEKHQIKPTTLGGLRTVTVDGCQLSPDPGGLVLPTATFHYRVSPDLRVSSVRVLKEEWTRLGEGYVVDDWGKAASLWGQERPFGAKLMEAGQTYGPDSWYPTEFLEYGGGGYLRGRRLEGIIVRPVRYRGDGGKLEYLSRLEIEVELEESSGGPVMVNRAIGDAEGSMDVYLRGLVRREIGEPHLAWMEEEGIVVEDEIGREGGFTPSALPDLDGSAVEYLIVTGEVLRTEFERLADWKTSKGIRTVVKTIEWIESSYPNASDLAETVRFFLREAYANWGTVYVLLGGDTDIVPVRYGFSGYYSEDGDEIPTDIYYSCLDGDWNGDGDEKWGEGRGVLSEGDQADLYPDVYVGRAPVDTPDEARVFVDKVIGYEKTPPLGYQNKALFFAEVLFPSPWDGQVEPYLDGGNIAETAAATLPEHFEIVKLYENHKDPDFPDALPLSKNRVLEELNKGYGIAHHVGHGYRTTMAIGRETLHNPDISSLSNGPRSSVVCALNCDAAAVDFNAIAETFLLNPDGGGVVYIGATRYDFPSTTWDYQDELYKLLFVHGVTRIGQAFAWSRLLHIPTSRNDNVGRWAQFGHILLGDPEMPVWTDSPSGLDLTVPAELTLGAQQLSVAVNRSGNGAPVAKARVVCIKDAEVYSVAFTDQSGEAVLEISPATAGTLSVMATAQDCLAVQRELEVTSSAAPSLYVADFSIDDTPGAGGDGDGLPEPGESLTVSFTLGNNGGTRSEEGTGFLSFGDDSYLTVEVGTVDIPPIYPGATSVLPLFVAHVSHSTPDGWRARGRAMFTAGQSSSYRDFALDIGAPIVEVYSTVIHDASGGDGDGAAEPGETIDVALTIRNSGRGSIHSMYALLETVQGDATVSADSVYFGSVEGGQTKGAGDFTIVFGNDPDPTLRLSLGDARGVFHTQAYDLVPPIAPEGVKGSGEDGTVKLLWSPARDSDLLGYVVYRSTSEGGPYERITESVVRSASVFENRNLNTLTKYFYVVTAQDSSGNESAFSTEAVVSTNPPRLTGWPLETDNESSGGVVIGDLDNDGDLEVVGVGGRFLRITTTGRR